jgi:hypothetical protein
MKASREIHKIYSMNYRVSSEERLKVLSEDSKSKVAVMTNETIGKLLKYDKK